MAPSSSPLRIVLVTWLYFPYVGGVATHVYEVATRLAKENNDVTILSTDPSGKLARKETAHGVKLIRVPTYPANKDYYYSPEIYHVLCRNTWDIIHVQGINTLVAPLAMLGALRTRTPFVLTPHTGHHASWFRNYIRPLHYRTLWPLVRCTKKLIALSELEARNYQRMLRLPSSLITVISNGSDLPQVETSNNQNDQQMLIASVGRLDPLKGHQRVVEALPQVLERYPDTRLRIVGEGAYEVQLRQLALEHGVADRVEIKGIPPWDRSAMAELLTQASLVTFLSDGENNPIAAMEAISMKCSVLVTHTSGLAPLADQNLAHSIPLGSTPSQIAHAIIQQLERPFTPTNINLLSWQECVNAIYKVYQETITQSVTF